MIELKELIKLRNSTELDLVYKITELAQSQTKDAEQVLKGNLAACIRVRHVMQEIRILACEVREMIQRRRSKKKEETGKGEEVSNNRGRRSQYLDELIRRETDKFNKENKEI